MIFREFLNTDCIKKIQEKIKWTEIWLFFSWFLQKIKLFFWEKWLNKFPKQWEIWNCYLWQNIWSEQNWDVDSFNCRPVFILKVYNSMNNIVVLPLTKQKKPDFISFKVWKEKYNFLTFNESFILYDQVRTVSKKRLRWNPFWKLEKDDILSVINWFKKQFFIFKKEKKD